MKNAANNNWNILIIDSDITIAKTVLSLLAKKHIFGTIADTFPKALKHIESSKFDLVIISQNIKTTTDSKSADKSTAPLLSLITKNYPELPLVMLTETQHLSNQQIIDLTKNSLTSGCSDILNTPLDVKKLESAIDSLLPCHQTNEAFRFDDNSKIIGRSAKLLQTIYLAERIAPTSAPVLITGESGTGKELISKLIHNKSKRAKGPYITVNCAALNDSLLESELFGHEKGAFTGAHSQRKGRFELASGGTLLLDEITETPLKFQAKLLRILEHQQFERVGGSQQVKINVRIISTSNRNLLELVKQNKFRKDLYYRLSAIRLAIAPLRQRTDDIEDLVWFFVNKYAHETKRNIKKLDTKMMTMFRKFSWPGNIRQLRNVVMTSLALGIGEKLALADVSWLFDELQPLTQQPTSPGFDHVLQHNYDTPGQHLIGAPLEKIEQNAIIETLKRTNGNQTKAAKVLGISDRTLRGKIKKYKQQGAMQLA